MPIAALSPTGATPVKDLVAIAILAQRRAEGKTMLRPRPKRQPEKKAA